MERQAQPSNQTYPTTVGFYLCFEPFKNYFVNRFLKAHI